MICHKLFQNAIQYSLIFPNFDEISEKWTETFQSIIALLYSLRNFHPNIRNTIQFYFFKDSVLPEIASFYLYGVTIFELVRASFYLLILRAKTVFVTCSKPIQTYLQLQILVDKPMYWTCTSNSKEQPGVLFLTLFKTVKKIQSEAASN